MAHSGTERQLPGGNTLWHQKEEEHPEKQPERGCAELCEEVVKQQGDP